MKSTPHKKNVKNDVLSDEFVRYQLIVENISEGILIANMEDTIIYASPPIERLTGYKSEDVIGLSPTDIVVNKDNRSNVHKIINSVKKGATHTLEDWHKHKISNEQWWARVSLAPLRSTDDQIIGTICTIADISTLVRSRQALAEAESRYRTVFDFAFDGIILFDGKTDHPLSCNKKVLEYFQCDAETFLKSSPLDFSPEFQPNGKTSEEMRADIVQELNKEGLIHYDWQHQRLDGSLFFTEISSYRIPDSQNNIRVVILKDITERLEAEKAIRLSQERLQMVLEAGQIGTWDWNIHTGRTVFNQRWAEMLGYTLDELEANDKTFDRLVHPDDLPEALNIIGKHLRGETPYFELELRMIAKDGSVRWIYDRGKITEYDDQDKPLRAAGIHLDITRQKESDEAKRDSEMRFRDLFENMYDALLITDAEGRFVDGNKSALRLLGYSFDELRHKKIKDIVHPEDQERSKVFLEKLLKDGYYSDYQGRILTKTGEIRYLQVNSTAIFKDGKFAGSRDIARDISALKAAELKREKLLLELEMVNKELKDFAYVVSHDLKAPLRAISSLSQWLAEDYSEELGEKGGAQLELLINRSNRMHHFIEGILEYSRIGRIKQDAESVDLQVLVEGVIKDLVLPAHFDIHMLQTLPIVSGPKLRLEQVFQNLLSNAIKYNDKEKGLIEIDFREDDEFYWFTVKDNGPGIDQKYHEKIFQIFQTLQARDSYESTGIGLTIVKRIIETNGGQIRLQSTVGQGSAFEFSWKKGGPTGRN